MRQARSIAVAVLAVGCGGGGDGGTRPAPVVDHVVITPGSPAVMTSFNATQPISAQAMDAANTPVDASVAWTTAAGSIVSLTPLKGATTSAKALANGSSTITATAGGKSAQVTVTVAQTFVSLGVNRGAITLAPNAVEQLTATLRDGGGSPLALAGLPAASFSSDNAAVASVDPASGVVTANAVGTATVTASATFAGVTRSATTAVTVQTGGASQLFQVATVGLSWSPSPITIHSGDRVQFTLEPIHNLLFNAGNPAQIAGVGSGTTPVGGQGASVTRTFNVTGTYNYECGVHPGMTGRIIVQP